jgi:hypothetical protein
MIIHIHGPATGFPAGAGGDARRHFFDTNDGFCPGWFRLGGASNSPWTPFRIVAKSGILKIINGNRLFFQRRHFLSPSAFPVFAAPHTAMLP